MSYDLMPLIKKRLRHHDGKLDLFHAHLHERVIGGAVAPAPAATAAAATDAAAPEAVGRSPAARAAHGGAPGLAERPVRRAHPAVAARVGGQRAEQPLRPQPRLQEQLLRRPARPPTHSDGELVIWIFTHLLLVTSLD